MTKQSRRLEDFDLATAIGRFKARSAGFDVPKQLRGWFREPRPFESYYVRTEGCWEWTGTIRKCGYGTYAANSKVFKAHRYAYEQHYGPIPSGLVVMHSCDNRKCVNPAHLSVGTIADNIADCVAKLRHARGIKKPAAKLTESDVREIRSIAVKGVRGHPCSWKRLAKRYGVDPTTIRAVCKGKTWSFV